MSASTSEVDLAIDDPGEGELPPGVVSAAVAQKRKRFGWIVVLSLALGTPILALIGAYVVLDWSGDRLADEAIAKAREAGDPLTVAEMEAYYPTSPAIEEATAHWLRAGEIIAAPSFGVAASPMPVLGRGANINQGDSIAPEDLPAVTAFLQNHQEALDEVHAARRAGAVARFPVDFGDGVAIQLPHSQKQRTLLNLLALDLEVHVVAGDAEAAVEDLLSMVAVSDSLANEPTLISQLVRVACLGVATQSLERTLSRIELNDEQLARLQEAYARQRLHDGIHRMARGEQFFLLTVVRHDAPTGDPYMDQAKWLPARGGDLAKGMELWRRLIDASDEGMVEAIDATVTMGDEIERLAGSKVDQFRYTTTMMVLPALHAVSDAFLRGEASVRTSVTALACERYRLKHGRFPATLEDLVPEFLPAVPEEPFAPIPLRYVFGEAEAVTYSRGLDREDDGGLDDVVKGDLPFELRSSNEAAPKEKP